MAVETVATNRRARHEYHINDRIEAGIKLTGPEVKSVRDHRVSLAEAYAAVENGEIWIHNMHIAKYNAGGYAAQNPTRPRKLLLHKREIKTLWDGVRLKGMTIIPTMLYLRDGLAKVEIALAKGKRQYDKRQAIKKRDMARDVDRALDRRDR